MRAEGRMSPMLDSAKDVPSPPRSVPWRDKVLPALVAAALGLTFLWAAGFADIDSLHNAAHDARHSAAFPCH